MQGIVIRMAHLTSSMLIPEASMPLGHSLRLYKIQYCRQHTFERLNLFYVKVAREEQSRAFGSAGPPSKTTQRSKVVFPHPQHLLSSKKFQIYLQQ
jgi:hypothetical protein